MPSKLPGRPDASATAKTKVNASKNLRDDPTFEAGIDQAVQEQDLREVQHDRDELLIALAAESADQRTDKKTARQSLDRAQDLGAELFRMRDQLKMTRMDAVESYSRVLDLEQQLRELVEQRDIALSDLMLARRQFEKSVDLTQAKEGHRQEAARRQAEVAQAQETHQQEAVRWQEDLAHETHQQEAKRWQADMAQAQEAHQVEAMRWQADLAQAQEAQQREAKRWQADLAQVQEAHQQEARRWQADLTQAQEAHRQEATRLQADLTQARKTHQQEARRLQEDLAQAQQAHRQEAARRQADLAKAQETHQQQEMRWEAELTQTREAVRSTESELIRMREHANAIALSFHEVLSSRSWRLTRGLRRIVEGARGRRWVEPRASLPLDPGIIAMPRPGAPEEGDD